MDSVDIDLVVNHTLEYLEAVKPVDSFTLHDLFISFGMSEEDFNKMKLAFTAVREFYRRLEEKKIIVVHEAMGFAASLPWYARLHLSMVAEGENQAIDKLRV